MLRQFGFAAIGVLVGVVVWFQSPDFRAWAKLRISMGADIQTDARTVREIQASFNRAEEAIGAGDLNALMALYSPDYRHGTFTKDDLRKSWDDVFSRYRRIITAHAFSKIVVTPGNRPTAKVTCTGSMWATSTATGDRVNVDSWVGEMHFLVYEEDAWRIRGPAKKVQGTAKPGVRAGPHPLF